MARLSSAKYVETHLLKSKYFYKVYSDQFLCFGGLFSKSEQIIFKIYMYMSHPLSELQKELGR